MVIHAPERIVGARGVEATIGTREIQAPVLAELRKVVWPTQEQLITYFIVVIVFVSVVMALVSLLDLGFGKLVFAVFG